MRYNMSVSVIKYRKAPYEVKLVFSIEFFAIQKYCHAPANQICFDHLMRPFK